MDPDPNNSSNPTPIDEPATQNVPTDQPVVEPTAPVTEPTAPSAPAPTEEPAEQPEATTAPEPTVDTSEPTVGQ